LLDFSIFLFKMDLLRIDQGKNKNGTLFFVLLNFT